MTRRVSRERCAELVSLAIGREDVESLAEQLLEPLRRYDENQDGDLMKTLEVYFSCGGNASRASEELFLHRNGLLYRLGRIEQLVGVSLSDRTAALALQLALQARRNDNNSDS